MTRDPEGDLYRSIFRHVPTDHGPATVTVEQFDKYDPPVPGRWARAEYAVTSETDPRVTGSFRAVGGQWFTGSTPHRFMRDAASAALAVVGGGR